MIPELFGTPGCGRNTRELTATPDDMFEIRDVVIKFNKDGSIKSCDYELSDEQLKHILLLRRHSYYDFDVLVIRQSVRKVSKFEIIINRIKSWFRRN